MPPVSDQLSNEDILSGIGVLHKLGPPFSPVTPDMFVNDTSSIFSMLNSFYLPHTFAQMDGKGNFLEWVKSVPFVTNVRSLVQLGAEAPVRSLLCTAAELLMHTPELQANDRARTAEFSDIKSARTLEIRRWDAGAYFRGGTPTLPNSWHRMQFCCFPPSAGFATTTTIQLAEQLLCSAALFYQQPDIFLKLQNAVAILMVFCLSARRLQQILPGPHQTHAPTAEMVLSLSVPELGVLLNGWGFSDIKRTRRGLLQLIDKLFADQADLTQHGLSIPFCSIYHRYIDYNWERCDALSRDSLLTELIVLQCKYSDVMLAGGYFGGVATIQTEWESIKFWYAGGPVAGCCFTEGLSPQPPTTFLLDTTFQSRLNHHQLALTLLQLFLYRNADGGLKAKLEANFHHGLARPLPPNYWG
jgi:hypothetical protein